MWETVRKFGLSFCDLPTMIWNIDVFLRVLTLKIDARNKKKIPVISYILITAFIGVYFYLYLVSMVWFVFIKCRETGDILAALIVFALGMASAIGIAKFFFMFYNANKIRKIVAQCLANNSVMDLNSRFGVNLTKTLRQVKIRAVTFWILVIGNGVVYIAKPIVMPGRHLMEDIYIIYGLEPMLESPNYEFAFIILTMDVCLTVYLVANITAFLIITAGYIEAEMLAWSEELLCLWEDANINYQDTLKGNTLLYSTDSDEAKGLAVNLYLKQQLKTIVQGHSANITVLRQLEDVLTGAIAVEFGLLVLDLIASLLGGLENTYLAIPFVLLQVSMDCLTGQRLMDASMVFERAVYDSKWEMFDKHNMKIVMIMLQNSQKMMTLSAGGITTLSFTCLMSVIRSIYSAYTTLRSTMK